MTTAFLIEASVKDPSTHEPKEPGNLTYRHIRTSRHEAGGVARDFLFRGMWVEIFDNDSQELLAGPFDPDQPAPAFIL